MNKPLMKKLLLALLLVPAVVLLYFGVFVWDAGVISNEPTMAAEKTTVAAETTTAVESAVKIYKILPDETSEGATDSSTTVTEVSTTTTAATTTQSAESTTAAATTAAPDKKPTTTTTEATTTTEKKTDTCTLTIDASAAGQGYYLSSYAVKVKNGDTAYDILCRACEANGISINAKTTGYGIYVAGINGLDEKEVGNSSGWLYYVNGTPPNKACSKYKVAVGDKITFYYTVDYSTP